MNKLSIKDNQGKMVLVIAVLASGISFLSTMTVSIALPAIQSFFTVSLSKIQWVVNGYALALAVLILIGGYLGDKYGRKKVLLFGMAIFLLGSIVSAISLSINQLIASQIIQGVGAAMIIPGSLAIINALFKEDEKGKVIGLWAGLSGAFIVAGPLLGGWIVHALGWRFIFWLNVPLVVIVWLLAKNNIEENFNTEYRKVDIIGLLFLSVAFLGLIYSLIEGLRLGWGNIFIIFGFSAFFIFIFLFIVWSRSKRSTSLIPADIFKKRIVLGANISTFLLYFGLSGAIFFIILNLQQIQGFDAIETGLALLPVTILIALFSGPAGSLADRIGPRPQMILGPLIVSGGFILIAFSGNEVHYFVDLLPGLILFGGGMAMTIAPLTKSALSVDSNFSGIASGVNNSISRVAALLAVALLGTVMTSLFTSTLEDRALRLPISAEKIDIILDQKYKVGGIEIPETFNPADVAYSKTAISESFFHGFKSIMIINAILVFLASIVAFFEIRELKVNDKSDRDFELEKL